MLKDGLIYYIGTSRNHCVTQVPTLITTAAFLLSVQTLHKKVRTLLKRQ